MQSFVAIDQELSEEIEGVRTGGPSDGRVSDSTGDSACVVFAMV